jgi:dimethylargininase
MYFTRAVLRLPGEDFVQGITTADLGAPNYEQMREQHAAYAAALRSLGVDTLVLDALPGCPDAYFVEDAALVFSEAAVITRPGAPARQGETESIAEALARFRPLEFINAPGTLDGGDVMMADRHFFIGISERTNSQGAAQLGKILEKYGYTWTAVPGEDGRLHLKSSCSYLGEKRILVGPDLAGCPEFAGYTLIECDPSEPYAANLILVNGTVIMADGFPGTRQRIEALGLPVLAVQASEPRKMDGGLSCMSLRF